MLQQECSLTPGLLLGPRAGEQMRQLRQVDVKAMSTRRQLDVNSTSTRRQLDVNSTSTRRRQVDAACETCLQRGNLRTITPSTQVPLGVETH
jgi:hypothetical protein